jgi:hypothetical protein
MKVVGLVGDNGAGKASSENSPGVSQQIEAKFIRGQKVKFSSPCDAHSWGLNRASSGATIVKWWYGKFLLGRELVSEIIFC